MALRTLQDLLHDQVRDLYDAERQLVKALPKMVKAASNPSLRQSFETHLRETEHQIERLEKVFELLGHTARGKKCAAMEGLIEEGQETLELNAEPDVKDAALIAAAQRVEHYEIAGYGTICSWADLIGLSDVKRLMGETLQEEKRTDELLTRLAEQQVNVQSVSG
jgi:ferritin-like metal-binding protein YciE